MKAKAKEKKNYDEDIYDDQIYDRTRRTKRNSSDVSDTHRRRMSNNSAESIDVPK